MMSLWSQNFRPKAKKQWSHFMYLFNSLRYVTHSPKPTYLLFETSAAPSCHCPICSLLPERYWKRNAGQSYYYLVLKTPMAFRVSNTSYNDFVISRPATSRSSGATCSLAKPLAENNQHAANQASELRHLSMANVLGPKFNFYGDTLWGIHGQPIKAVVPQRSIVCHSTRFRGTEEKQKTRSSDGQPEMSSVQIREKDEHQVMPRRIIHSNLALAEACKFVYNDAKFVNERARNDMVLLSRGIMRLDARARKDVAILGSGFLKLDARAREDTEKIDRDMKAKAERLQHVASMLKDRAESRIKKAADKHWSDGALEADLRRADIRAKQRAMEDALMALELIKNIHDRMVNKMYEFRELGSVSGDGMLNFTDIKLEKNGMTGNFFPGEVSTDRITAIQNAYWSMASALSEADGIDYTDPEELELLIATLIDLDAMDGKSSVSLLAECSSSPDVGTRKALANALAAAPSMWTLGNAGMGALQRLAEDSNLSIAAAASRAIYELKKQWEIEEGDSWRFTMNIKPADQVENPDDEGGETDS